MFAINYCSDVINLLILSTIVVNYFVRIGSDTAGFAYVNVKSTETDSLAVIQFLFCKNKLGTFKVIKVYLPTYFFGLVQHVVWFTTPPVVSYDLLNYKNIHIILITIFIPKGNSQQLKGPWGTRDS